ncbi:MAG: NAD-dependent epimerase/dehydratase family protein [Myxococcota bacterium]
MNAVLAQHVGLPVLSHFPRVVREDLPSIAEQLQSRWAALSGRHVFITGANGMLAAYLADTLAYLNDAGVLQRPCRLTLLVRSAERARERFSHLIERRDVTFLAQDVCAPLPAALRPALVVHAAAPASPRAYLADPLASLDANTFALRSLFDRVLEQPPESALYISSSEVYGTPEADAIPTSEAYVGRIDPLSRRAYYAEAKRAGETYCLAYHEARGLKVKVARPFHVHGPGLRLDDGRIVPALIAMGLRGERLALESDGRATRTYGYVADATVQLFSILLSDFDGHAFNVGNDRPETSVLELANEIASLFGQSEPVKVNTAPGNANGRGAPARACPDLGKLKRSLGLEPRIGLREGLARTIRWFSKYD